MQFPILDHYIQGDTEKLQLDLNGPFSVYVCNDPEWETAYKQASSRNRFQTEYFTRKRGSFIMFNGFSLQKLWPLHSGYHT